MIRFHSTDECVEVQEALLVKSQQVSADNTLRGTILLMYLKKHMDERIYPEFCGNHTNLGSSPGFWLPTPWPDWSVPGVPALLAAPYNRQNIHSYQQRSICVAYRSPLVMQLLSSVASSGDEITRTSLLNQAACRSPQEISLKSRPTPS